jgi:hypothetical protein
MKAIADFLARYPEAKFELSGDRERPNSITLMVCVGARSSVAFVQADWGRCESDDVIRHFLMAFERRMQREEQKEMGAIRQAMGMK